MVMFSETKLRALLVVFLSVTMVAGVRADGGVIVLDGQAGPFLVTAFAAPAPLRAGPVDLSVLVRDAQSGQPVLDAEVRLVLRHGAGSAGASEPDDQGHAGHVGHESHSGMETTPGFAGGKLIEAVATREEATNKLLRAARIELPAAGEWTLTVSVSRRSAEADISAALTAGAPLPAWISRWQVILLPLLVVLLFLANKGLAHRRHGAARN